MKKEFCGEVGLILIGRYNHAGMEVRYKSHSGALPGCSTTTHYHQGALSDGRHYREGNAQDNPDLETDGYVTKIREGRRLRYRINPDVCLPDEMLQDKEVGDFLEVPNWRRRRRPIQNRELVAVGDKAEP